MPQTCGKATLIHFVFGCIQISSGSNNNIIQFKIIKRASLFILLSPGEKGGASA